MFQLLSSLRSLLTSRIRVRLVAVVILLLFNLLVLLVIEKRCRSLEVDEWQLISEARKLNQKAVVLEKKFVQAAPGQSHLIQLIDFAVKKEKSFKMISRNIYEKLMVKYEERYWAVFTSQVNFYKQRKSSMYFKGDYFVAQNGNIFVAIFETGTRN